MKRITLAILLLISALCPLPSALAQYVFKAGTTSQDINLFVIDTSQTGTLALSGLTTLAYNTSGLKAYYRRDGGAAASITLATLSNATAAFSSGGLIATDSTNMPGHYRLDVPDAAIASGAKFVTIELQGAANMAPVVALIRLTATDDQDATRLGLTALPNANAGASGGLLINGTNTAVAISAGSLTLTGLISSGSISTAGLVNSASTSLAGVTSTGSINFGSVNLTGLVDSGSFSTASMSIGGITGAGSLNLGSINVNGIVDAGSLAIGSISSSGASSLGTLTVGTAIVTNGVAMATLSTSGAATFNSFTVTNKLGAGSLAVTNGLTAATINVSGAATFGGITDSGSLALGSISSSGASSFGTLTVGTLNVTNGFTAGSSNFGISTFTSLNDGTFAIGTISLANASNLSLLTIGTISNYTGNTPQTGDSFARLGAPSGASIDADILSRLATSGYTAPPTAAQNATAIWQDATGSDFTTANSAGKSIYTGVAPGAQGGLLASGASSATFNFTGTGSFPSWSIGTISNGVGSVVAAVTVGTNNDKNGYALTGAQSITSLAIANGLTAGSSNFGVATFTSLNDGTFALGTISLANASNLSLLTVGTVSHNADKSGYALTQAFPANFSALDISGAGVVLSSLNDVNGDSATPTELNTLVHAYTGGTLDIRNVTGNVINRVVAGGGTLNNVGSVITAVTTGGGTIDTVSNVTNNVKATLPSGSALASSAQVTALQAYLNASMINLPVGSVLSAGAATVEIEHGDTSTVNNYYTGTFYIVSNTGWGEMANIVSYNGTTHVLTLDRTWVVTPDTSSTWAIAPPGLAAVDWSKIYNAAATLNFSNTNVGTVGTVTNPVTPKGVR